MRNVRSIALATVVALGGLYLVSSGYAKPLAPGIRVGVLVSDSGDLGFAGPIQRAAARLAIKDLVDEKSPVEVELSFVDVGDSETDNLRAFTKLKALDCDLIIAPIESTSARELVKSNLKNPVPIIAPSALVDHLGKSTSKPWFFRLASSPSQDSFALSDFMTRSKTSHVLIVSGSADQSRDQMKSLASALALDGVRAQTLNIRDIKAISKTKPDAMVLLSMEESLAFFSALEDWATQIPQVYLVPSNLADYSAYPWSKALKGALALSPRTIISSDFKADLAKALGNQAVMGSRGAVVLGLGQKTYEAVKLAVEARSKASSKGPEELRSAISMALSGGKRVFNKLGFYAQSEYSVFRYGSSGTFALSSLFSPN